VTDISTHNWGSVAPIPAQFWKKATYGIAIATAAIAGLGLPPAIAASAAPIPAPVTMVPVPCSARALNASVAAAPPSSILALAPECTYELTHSLPAIGDTLNLRGPATIAMSGPPDGPILTVAASGNVTTDHVSFTGGDTSGPHGSGGAIYNDGGTVAIYFGSFSHNKASAYGGAICNAGGQLKVIDATFIDNSALQGGAIENFGRASINRAHFTTNTATSFGGAIENEDVTTIYSSTFHANTAYSGGAAYNKKRTLTILHSSFSDNQTAIDPATLPKSDMDEPPSGGGVANLARMTLNGDSFDSNGYGPTSNGGAVYNDGTAKLTDSILSGNHSVVGGGFYNDARAKLTGDTIRANSTTHDGGGIYNSNSGWLKVSETRFHGNHAGLDGGGLLNGAFAKISGSQFYLNSAGIGGGGIHDYYKLRLTRTVLRDNKPDNCESRLGAKRCVH
jgi:hypothetical protein